MRLLIFTTIFFFFIISIIHTIDFNAEDQITLFQAATFNTTIAASRTAYVVEFFSHTCGYCISFAPTFSQFARNIKGWSGVVKVGAVTSDDRGFFLSNSVHKFPSIKFYLPWAKGGVVNLDGSTVGELNGLLLDAMRVALLDGRGLETWPRLNYVINIDEMMEEVMEKPEQIHMLVVEDEQAQKEHLGEILIMDHSAALKEVNIMRSHIDLASQHNMNNTGLYLLMNQQFVRMPGIFNRSGLNDLVSNLIRMHTNSTLNITKVSYGSHYVENLTVTDETYVYRVAHGLHASDLLVGLRHTLWSEVAGARDIMGPSMAALKAFLGLLIKYLPVDEHVTYFLSLILEGLKDLNSISSSDWLNMLNTFQTDLAYIPDNLSYKGCKGSEEHLRGYPCSVWMMFHSVTVASALSPLNKTLPSNKIGLHTLLTIRNYMQYFFSCKECTNNFLKHTLHWTRDLLNPASVWSDKRAVLEMWKLHNLVNQRLHHSPLSEDPLHPKIQFPAQPDCGVCRRRVVEGGSVFAYQYSDWDLEEVYEYMVGYYSQTNSKSCHDTGKSILVTSWTPCSMSCDTGLSVRMSNHNEECVLRMEIRLCIDVPCNLTLPQEQDCRGAGSMYRLGTPLHLSTLNCTSEALQDWKVCGRCSHEGSPVCCRPSTTSSKKVKMTCSNLEVSREADDGWVWLNRSGASVTTVATTMTARVVDMCQCSQDFC